MDSERLYRNLRLTADVVDKFAGVCNAMIGRKNPHEEGSEDLASALLAGALQFAIKSMSVAGFSKEEILKATGVCFDCVQDDEDVVRAKMMREFLKDEKNTRPQ